MPVSPLHSAAEPPSGKPMSRPPARHCALSGARVDVVTEPPGAPVAPTGPRGPAAPAAPLQRVVRPPSDNWVMRSPEEVKPVYVDWSAPVLVELLARLSRQAAWLSLSEMLPGPDELWLRDAAGADLSSAVLTRATLTMAVLGTATLRLADFGSANLTGADLTAVLANNSRFVGANLSSARLTEANLAQADLRNATLTGALGPPLNASQAVYEGTTCPNGMSSDNTNSCVGQGF